MNCTNRNNVNEIFVGGGHTPKAKWLFLCFLLIANISMAQYNLVPNHSFENYTVCPTFSSNPPPPPWYLATSSFNQDGTYCNACSSDPCVSVPYNCLGQTSYQEARTGNGYDLAGFFYSVSNTQRVYLQTKLNYSLTNGKCYYVEYFVSLGNTSKYGCNNISLLFTKLPKYVDTLVDPYGVIQANAQIQNYGNPIITDTLNWVKVSGVYTALGGEQYITIGNFKNNNQTNKISINPAVSSVYHGAEYYIDDVSVIPLDSMPLKADAGRDTTIKLGDSVFIGSLTNGLTGVVWYDANNAVINSAAGVPGFWVKPPLSTFYVIEQTVCGYYSRDTVWVNVNPLPVKLISFIATVLPPSPLGEGLGVRLNWQTATEINVSHFNVQRSQTPVGSVNGKDFTIVGKVAANNKNSNEYSYEDAVPLAFGEGLGVRFYRLEMVDKDGKKEYSKIVKVVFEKKGTVIQVYPNPAKDKITISGKDIISIEITDYTGRIVKQVKVNNNTTLIPIADRAKGLYIIKAKTIIGNTIIQKLVVE